MDVDEEQAEQHQFLSVEVDQSEAQSQAHGGKNDTEERTLRWDVLITFYLISIATTELCLGRSVEATYDDPIRVTIYGHFAAETTLSLHFLYSPRWAFRFSAVAVVIFLVEIVCILMQRIDFTLTTTLTFIFSDGLSLIASVCVLFNNAMPREFKVLPTAILPHFVGVLCRMAIIPEILFEHQPLDVPQYGLAWFLIGVSIVPQIWLLRDAIRGKLNRFGPVRYDDTLNSKYYIAFCKFGAPCVALLAAVLFGVMGMFQTVQVSESDLKVFAVRPWSDLIAAVFMPVSIASTFCIVYLCSTRTADDSKTEQ